MYNDIEARDVPGKTGTSFLIVFLVFFIPRRTFRGGQTSQIFQNNEEKMNIYIFLHLQNRRVYAIIEGGYLSAFFGIHNCGVSHNTWITRALSAFTGGNLYA